MSKTEFIDLFCKATGFEFVEDGEIGFGRKCCGIIEANKNHYVSYTLYDKEYNTIARHKAAGRLAPDSAYHKGDYLVVLKDRTGTPIEDLEAWIKTIWMMGFQVRKYRQRSSLINSSTSGPLMLKAIVDTDEKFPEDAMGMQK